MSGLLGIAYRYQGASSYRSFDRRHAFVHSFLASLPCGSSVIDMGAGTQKFRANCAHLNYVAQDFCEYDGKGDGGANQSGHWDVSKVDIVSDITAVPVADNMFDAAICIDVLEHVPDPVSAIKEILRIVRPGGSICIAVPTQCDSHQTPYFFSGGYSRYFFADHFKGHQIAIKYESGYFETVDQKLFRGFESLCRLARERRAYFPALLIYTLLAIPTIFILRTLPDYEGEVGNNGILVRVTKASA